MKPAKALAAAAGDLKTVRAMVNEDNALATDWKPIMDACYVGQSDAVALMLEHGADPNVKSKKSGGPPLPPPSPYDSAKARRSS